MFRYQPTTQEFKNPLKWGWYYIDRPSGPSGLMNKRTARLELRRSNMDSYGAFLRIHDRAPNIKLVRRVTFPVRKLT